MSTDVADATETETKKRRGGQRGERSWREKPTVRERVLNQSLAEHVKAETGKDVSPETIRAVRWSLPKWNSADSTKTLRKNMETKLEKAKLQDKRQKALDMLREAESELKKFDGSADLDDEDDEEDEEDEEIEEDFDEEEDEDEEDEEDVFSSTPKVTKSFV